SNTTIEVHISKDLINVVGNYSAAIYVLELPMHDKQSIWLLGNATLIDPEIGNSKPIIIIDATNRTFIISSNNIPRKTWMKVEFLKRKPHVIREREKFEWIEAMFTQLDWEFFDDIHYGPTQYNLVGKQGNVGLYKIFKPTDEKVWEVILKFYDYMDELPKVLRENGIEPLYYYFNSTEFKKQFPNDKDRGIVLYVLAYIPPATWDIDKRQPICGIEGMIKFVEQLSILRDAIIKLYKQAKVDESKVYKILIEEKITSYLPSLEKILKVIEGNLTREYEIARYGYWQWICDRANNGLFNTALQYTEFDKHLIEIWKEKWNWDLIRFIKGATRGSKYTLNIPGFFLDEGDTYKYGYPLTFKSLGIPLAYIYYDPYIFGTSWKEWAVPLPTNIAEELINQFKDKIVFGPGYFFSLFSAVDGAEKDGIKEIYSYDIIRRRDYYDRFCLWKKN
ncbi:MAG: hypothetical protein QW678_03535, partial [Candidatus Aenigmatarchaeota archaeon]